MRLVKLEKKQIDLIKPLAEHGITASASELSLAINGKAAQDKHKKILETVDVILTEWENSK